MKNLISKIRNKRLKGNISLLVILILLASSVVALLSISQIQHLITYWDMTFNYFRAFYLAKAWTELGLTEVYNRENWFEDKIENTINDDGTVKFDQIIEKNFLWEGNKYKWSMPYFTMTITWNFESLTDDIRNNKCNDENKITLMTWDGFVLSLFEDNTEGYKNILNSDYIDGIKALDNNKIKSLKFGSNSTEWDLMFWLFGYNKKWNMTNIIVENSENNDLNEFLKENIEKVGWTRRYLSIKNAWDKEPVSFCIKWNWDIPYSNYIITVRGNYADMEVWLQSVVKKEFPSWSLNVLWWEE